MAQSHTPTHRLGSFVSNCTHESIAQPVLEKAVTCLLDGLGLALLSRDEHTSVATRGLAVPAQGAGTARIWANGVRTVASDAVLANAIAVHAHFHDDTDYSSWTHPGSLIVSVAATLGESIDASLDIVLRGIVAGYDALAWLGADERVARALIGRGFRTSPTLGAIGAAATAAVILRLNQEAATNAIAIASSFAAGVLEPVRVGSDEWRIQNGHAARGGLLAAQLAARGVVGAPSGLEGSKGLARVLGDLEFVPEWEREPRVDAILDVVVKPWATLGDNMAAVAAAKLLHDDGVQLERIKSIRVKIWRPYAEFPGTSYRGPFEKTAQALASTVFATSAMLVCGDLEYEVSQDRRNDPQILRLAAMTTVEPDDEGGPMDGSVEITLLDGSVQLRTASESPRTLLYHDRATSIEVFESRLCRCGFSAGQGTSLAESTFASAGTMYDVNFAHLFARILARD